MIFCRSMMTSSFYLLVYNVTTIHVEGGETMFCIIVMPEVRIGEETTGTTPTDCKQISWWCIKGYYLDQ